MKTRIGDLTAVEVVTGAKSYPDALKPLFVGRHKAKLGEVVGTTQFGVNYTTLDPASASALRHWHEVEDEFVFILEGELVLIDENGEHVLSAGSFVGFPAGSPNGHHLVNRSDRPASFIEIGSRRPGADTAHCPDDDFGPLKR